MLLKFLHTIYSPLWCLPYAGNYYTVVVALRFAFHCRLCCYCYVLMTTMTNIHCMNKKQKEEQIFNTLSKRARWKDLLINILEIDLASASVLRVLIHFYSVCSFWFIFFYRLFSFFSKRRWFGRTLIFKISFGIRL